VVDHVVEDERPERSDARHGEHFDAAAHQAPERSVFGITPIHAGAGACRGCVEEVEDGRPRGQRGERGRRLVQVEIRRLEDGTGPVRDVPQMRREAAERHRFLVRLPAEALVGQPFQQSARRRDLVVVIGEQRVLETHAR
jgi:hypothetical protein